VLICLILNVEVMAQKKQLTEYEFKAALIFNLIKYTVWPDEAKHKDGDEVDFVVGVIGKDPFGKAWKLIDRQKVRKMTISVRQFCAFREGKYPQEQEKQISDLKKCRLLFIGTSEKKNIADIISVLKGGSVMTISETPEFLEQKGMVNFLVEKKKVLYEINLDVAQAGRLKINTTVLKMAKRVLQKKKQSRESKNEDI